MKYILSLLTVLSLHVNAGGIASGVVTDISIRTQDDVMVIIVDSYNSPTECVTWAHSLGMKYGTDASKALYSMFLTSKTSAQKVRVVGTGTCDDGSGGNTGFEVIEQANFGNWAL